MERFFANLTLFASLLFLPWWTTAALVAVFAFFLPSLYEAVFWGVLGDLLYAAPASALGGIPILMGAGALLVVLSAEYLKRRVRQFS